MKKIWVLYLLGMFMFSTMSFSQSYEPAVYSGAGFLNDASGSGFYAYFQAGAMKKKNNHRFGGAVNTVLVDVEFSEYRYQAKELAFIVAYDTWKRLNEAYTISFWFNPGWKFFWDKGESLTQNLSAKQRDYGIYVVSGMNLNDNKNRWFSSYKVNVQVQQVFWSNRLGTWENEDGYLSDNVNVKAVNKAYYKGQIESSVKKILFPKWQLEPRLVAGYLWDGGSSKSMYEVGPGLAFAFMRGDRYYEICNLQYRFRLGTGSKEPLSLIELNLDFSSLYLLLKN